VQSYSSDMQCRSTDPTALVLEGKTNVQDLLTDLYGVFKRTYTSTILTVDDLQCITTHGHTGSRVNPEKNRLVDEQKQDSVQYTQCELNDILEACVLRRDIDATEYWSNAVLNGDLVGQCISIGAYVFAMLQDDLGSFNDFLEKTSMHNCVSGVFNGTQDTAYPVLMVALNIGALPYAELLIKYLATLQDCDFSRNIAGYSPLYLSRRRSWSSPFHTACATGNIEMAKKMHAYTPWAHNTPDTDGYTGMLLAICSYTVTRTPSLRNTVQWLCGFDLSKAPANRHCVGLLVDAVRVHHDNIHLLEYVLIHCNNVHIGINYSRNADVLSPLLSAVGLGMLDVTQLLVLHGADSTTLDVFGKGIALTAIVHNHLRILEWISASPLLHSGCIKGDISNYGMNVLHCAVVHAVHDRDGELPCDNECDTAVLGWLLCLPKSERPSICELWDGRAPFGLALDSPNNIPMVHMLYDAHAREQSLDFCWRTVSKSLYSMEYIWYMDAATLQWVMLTWPGILAASIPRDVNNMPSFLCSCLDQATYHYYINILYWSAENPAYPFGVELLTLQDPWHDMGEQQKLAVRQGDQLADAWRKHRGELQLALRAVLPPVAMCQLVESYLQRECTLRAIFGQEYMALPAVLPYVGDYQTVHNYLQRECT
jgi:hypothetical protein